MSSRPLRFLVAAKLYELGWISSERAVQIAGVERVDVLEWIGSYRISGFNYGAEELESELESARKRGKQRS